MQPRAIASSTTPAPSSKRRTPANVRYPWHAKAIAAPRPIPVDAPVTNTADKGKLRTGQNGMRERQWSIALGQAPTTGGWARDGDGRQQKVGQRGDTGDKGCNKRRPHSKTLNQGKYAMMFSGYFTPI